MQRHVFADAGAAAAAWEANVWERAVPYYPMCDGAEPPQRTPATEAVSYWRTAGEDLLPKPAPHIAPGWMLAGKLGYLETNSAPTAHFEHSTPLGVLVIDATSELYVDWGDGGGVHGPVSGPGKPWPDGEITHSWTTASTYDVTVSQRWTATWRLGDASGTLDGLTTEATIDDFQVRQLQAVRNR